MHPKIDILAFAAHPDDVEISAAGIMIKHKEAGLKTAVIDLTAGELGSRGSAELRKTESEQASLIMQLDARENLGFRDGFLEVNENALMSVVRIIRKYRPDIMLINAETDRHPDHGIAHTLVKRAAFLSGLVKIETHSDGVAQAAWRPKAIYAYIQDQFIHPDVLVDVSEQWEKRMACLMAYSSQFYNPASTEPLTPISTPEFMKNIEGRSVQLARHIQCRHAEGLNTVRPIGTHLLTDLI